MIPYTITNDTINVVIDGKPHVVKRGAANFYGLQDALLSQNWDIVPQHLSAVQSVAAWAQCAGLDHKIEGFVVSSAGELQYKNRQVPRAIHRRAEAMAAAGKEPIPLFRFFERLVKNPSHRSVEQLYEFLEHEGIPIQDDGTFLAYKAVDSEYRDFHTGSHDNSVGQVLEMERNLVSDDPNEACHFGFHVGALPYVSTFGSNRRIVVCKVDPEHVVAVPYDCSQHKMRVCKYEVVGHHSTQMPDTTYSVDEERADAAAAAEAENPESYAENRAGGSYTKLDNMDAVELLELSLAVLRDYAASGLRIIGATKIPGGKIGLLERIISARGY